MFYIARHFKCMGCERINWAEIYRAVTSDELNDALRHINETHQGFLPNHVSFGVHLSSDVLYKHAGRTYGFKDMFGKKIQLYVPNHYDRSHAKDYLLNTSIAFRRLLYGINPWMFHHLNFRDHEECITYFIEEPNRAPLTWSQLTFVPWIYKASKRKTKYEKKNGQIGKKKAMKYGFIPTEQSFTGNRQNSFPFAIMWS